MAAKDHVAAPELWEVLEGARIEHVEKRDDGMLVVVFGHKGTDDGSGYLIVGQTHVHYLSDYGDPDAWRAEL